MNRFKENLPQDYYKEPPTEEPPVSKLSFTEQIAEIKDKLVVLEKQVASLTEETKKMEADLNTAVQEKSQAKVAVLQKLIRENNSRRGELNLDILRLEKLRDELSQKADKKYSTEQFNYTTQNGNENFESRASMNR